jgi:hypothetical protein
MLPELDWDDDAPTRVRTDGKLTDEDTSHDARDQSGMVRIKRRDPQPPPEPQPEPREDTGVRMKRVPAFDPRKTVVGLAPPPIPPLPDLPRIDALIAGMTPSKPAVSPSQPPPSSQPPLSAKQTMQVWSPVAAQMAPTPTAPMQAMPSYPPPAYPQPAYPQPSYQPAVIPAVAPPTVRSVNPEELRRKRLLMIVIVTVAVLALFAASVLATAFFAR